MGRTVGPDFHRCGPGSLAGCRLDAYKRGERIGYPIRLTLSPSPLLCSHTVRQLRRLGEKARRSHGDGDLRWSPSDRVRRRCGAWCCGGGGEVDVAAEPEAGRPVCGASRGRHQPLSMPRSPFSHGGFGGGGGGWRPSPTGSGDCGGRSCSSAYCLAAVVVVAAAAQAGAAGGREPGFVTWSGSSDPVAVGLGATEWHRWRLDLGCQRHRSARALWFRRQKSRALLSRGRRWVNVASSGTDPPVTRLGVADPVPAGPRAAAGVAAGGEGDGRPRARHG